jgi:group I intron endonuclease
MKKIFIYELIDPITFETRYIGKTFSIEKRYKGHLRDKAFTYKVNWIRSLLKQGLEPIINIIDEVEENEANFWEIFYISLFKSWGFRLTNGTKGGENLPNNNGRVRTKETREKIRKIRLGTKLSEETKEKISKGNKGIKKGPMSEEHKLKDSIAHKGKKASEETKLKMSKAGKEKTFSEEHKKNISINKTGKPNCKVRRPILQFDLEGNFIKEWDCAYTASKELRIDNGAICCCCKNKLKQHKGFIFKYKS